MGLFLTSHPPADTLDWFASFHRPEYARQHFISTRTITLPAGPILSPLTDDASGDPFPHSMEPQFRQLGLKTTLVKGVPSLMDEHVLCREGEKLTSEKCRILKLLGVQMAVSSVLTMGAFMQAGRGKGTLEQKCSG
jgi:mRNA turnover protein 4